MPGARTHDALTLATGVALIPTVWAVLPDHNIAAAVTVASAHIISGLAFSPDLDLDSEPYRRWGPLRLLWYPYREAIGHRSWISHSLVVGPLLRLLYFLLMTALLMATLVLLLGVIRPVDGRALLAALGASLGALWMDHRAHIIYFLLGFISGGAVHTAADWLTTRPDPHHGAIFKRRRARRRRRNEWGIF
ncbi:MAG: metal-binding protein [Herpetosiphonaceae bacterium]|nr:MAG: metal-binding protein [Herpetosiphonaceae bacterium]